MDYNAEVEEDDIVITQNNTIDMSWDLYEEGNLYDSVANGSKDLSTEQLDLEVYNGNNVKIYDFSSAGTSPAITLTSHSYNLSVAAASRVFGKSLKFDILKTNGAEKLTIKRGNWINNKQYTI